MTIPYRTRQFLRRLLAAVLVLALIAAGVLLCWLLWLHRYVVYTQDGAKLDFNLSLEYPQGETAVPPEPLPTVNIQYDEDKPPELVVNTELVRFSGYYVTLEALLADFDGITDQLAQLSSGETLLIDVKTVKSYSYYSTDVGMPATDFDTTKLDKLIRNLQNQGIYLIARIPAFQEYEYILEDQTQRVPFGLPRKGGNGSLWLDKEGPCYWMNPASDGTLTYLIQTITELRLLGFDEVVLKDFRFPNTDQIRFDEDKTQTLVDLAAKLVKTCATDTFCVSFSRAAPDLPLPEGRTRLYLENISAVDAAAMAQQTGFPDPSIHVVFLADTGDNRFDKFCVLRPLDMMH